MRRNVARPRLTLFPQGLEHGLDVAGDLHLAPDPADDAVAVDQPGRAVDAHIFAAVELLLDPGPVALDDVALGVGAEFDGQAVFGPELPVLGGRVLGDPDDG